MSINRTPKTWGAEELTSSDLNAEVKNLWTGLQAAWDSYTPTWTASTVNPTLGNGTIAGQYLQIGKTVLYRIALTLGSTTVRGTGAYGFSLPVAAAHTVSPCGQSFLRDTSSANNEFRFAIVAVSGVVNLYDTAGVVVTSAVPWSWDPGDSLTIAGSYEAA